MRKRRSVRGLRTRSRLYKRKRFRGSSSRNKNTRPRNQELNSKRLTFRQRSRVVLVTDPVNNEGAVIQLNPNFGAVPQREYLRVRAQALDFQRCQYVGVTVLIKRIREEEIAETSAAPLRIDYKIISNARCRVVPDTYADSASLSVNPNAIDVATGSKSVPMRRGVKAVKWRMPKSWRVATGFRSPDLFPVVQPSMDMHQLVVEQYGANTNDFYLCPNAVLVHFDSMPSPAAPLAGITVSHITNFEVYVYWHFNAYGKVLV